MWWRRFFRSFRYAGQGIVRSVRNERNLRFHLTAAMLAHLLGLLAALEPGEMAVISLCCGLVIGLELVNTAVEALCDRVCPAPDSLIKTAKDAAAGAVLAAAVCSVIAALWLFGGSIVSGALWDAVRTRPALDAAIAVTLVAGIFFVRWDGK